MESSIGTLMIIIDDIIDGSFNGVFNWNIIRNIDEWWMNAGFPTARCDRKQRYRMYQVEVDQKATPGV